MIGNKEIEIRKAIKLLKDKGCLEVLLDGREIEANNHGHSSLNGTKGARGRNILKDVRNAANRIYNWHYNNGLLIKPVAEIDFNNSVLKIKREYLNRFKQAVLAYT